jgi:hypothetical protein
VAATISARTKAAVAAAKARGDRGNYRTREGRSSLTPGVLTEWR